MNTMILKKPEKPTDREICVELIRLLYKIEPAGGMLHIVLDDDNVADEYILFCVQRIQAEQNKLIEQGRIHTFFEMAIALYLVGWSEEERLEVINQALRGDA